MGDTNTEAETRAEQSQDYTLENIVEPHTVSIEDMIKKESSPEEVEVRPLFITVEDIKQEIPDLTEEPGCSKWDLQCAPGPSLKVVNEEPDCGLLGNKEIKSEPPDSAIKEEMSTSEDGSNLSFPEDGHSQGNVTMSGIKSETDGVYIKTKEELKQEEVMLVEKIEFQIAPQKTKRKLNSYQCPHCSFKIRYKRDLKSHLKTHEGNVENYRFRCTFCSFKTKYQTSFKSHLLIHKEGDEISWFECKHCSFKAKRKKNLDQHLILHKDDNEINWFQCAHCSFKSKRKNLLKEHLIVHEEVGDINWFECTHCSYKTLRNSNLKRHLIVHKGDEETKWFNCTDCSFKTKHEGQIEAHSIIHKEGDEINWFQCTYCIFKTKRNRDLKRHLIRHDDNTWLHCTKCDFKTKYKKSLQSHLLTHEKNESM